MGRSRVRKEILVVGVRSLNMDILRPFQHLEGWEAPECLPESRCMLFFTAAV